ncbi:hypothetical protein TanjilG_12754 [Lupinus angustifolius]|uniref:Amino acid transporter transmembrane domain-containing protein n=1 Tax=Lupinus angustifolius TaxID=3871 RepID=A0A1J7GDY8_LUPAN|nr:PREDICTED: vacuolar amino acid transporter 1-like [Lupinus angustifolius]OIV98631.1 hypothetical protein TanjilG_12754 [Lupinus angustifolius]
MKRGELNLDNDLDPHHEDVFQTDDEENQAYRVFENLSDDSDSENNSPPSKNLSNEIAISTSWPQSYRTSMELLTSVTVPGGVSFLSRNASKGTSDSFFKGLETWQDDDSLFTKPLVSEDPSSKKQCSFAQSVINGINILCGVGILTIPYAVKEGGWLSLIILLVFSIICCYTGILLKRCLDNYPELETFPDIGQAAFGIAGRLCIAIILFMELYASCVEYITLMSDNLSSLFPNANVTFGGADIGTHQVFAITAAILVLPTVWIKNLSLLSYVSVGGIFATILVTLCLFWVGIADQVGYKPGAKVFDLANLSVAIGIYGFGFGGHAVFPSIYSSMKEPANFQSVLYVSFAFCLAMYTGVAAMGYLTFGDAVESQFTLNMPQELYASKIAAWTTIATPLAKYALTLLPIAMSIEELAPTPQLRCHAMSVVVRTVLVITSLIVALSVPYFGSLMALIGSFMSMLVALIFPCLCYLKLHSGRLSKIQIINCILIIIVGVVSGCAGTYSAMSKIINGEG